MRIVETTLSDGTEAHGGHKLRPYTTPNKYNPSQRKKIGGSTHPVGRPKHDPAAANMDANIAAGTVIITAAAEAAWNEATQTGGMGE